MVIYNQKNANNLSLMKGVGRTAGKISPLVAIAAVTGAVTSNYANESSSEKTYQLNTSEQKKEVMNFLKNNGYSAYSGKNLDKLSDGKIEAHNAELSGITLKKDEIYANLKINALGEVVDQQEKLDLNLDKNGYSELVTKLTSYDRITEGTVLGGGSVQATSLSTDSSTYTAKTTNDIPRAYKINSDGKAEPTTGANKADEVADGAKLTDVKVQAKKVEKPLEVAVKVANDVPQVTSNLSDQDKAKLVYTKVQSAFASGATALGHKNFSQLTAGNVKALGEKSDVIDDTFSAGPKYIGQMKKELESKKLYSGNVKENIEFLLAYANSQPTGSKALTKATIRLGQKNMTLPNNLENLMKYISKEAMVPSEGVKVQKPTYKEEVKKEPAVVASNYKEKVKPAQKVVPVAKPIATVNMQYKGIDDLISKADTQLNAVSQGLVTKSYDFSKLSTEERQELSNYISGQRNFFTLWKDNDLGKFNPTTKEGVKAAQVSIGLGADGMPGKRTLTYLSGKDAHKVDEDAMIATLKARDKSGTKHMLYTPSEITDLFNSARIVSKPIDATIEQKMDAPQLDQPINITNATAESGQKVEVPSVAETVATAPVEEARERFTLDAQLADKYTQFQNNFRVGQFNAQARDDMRPMVKNITVGELNSLYDGLKHQGEEFLETKAGKDLFDEFKAKAGISVVATPEKIAKDYSMDKFSSEIVPTVLNSKMDNWSKLNKIEVTEHRNNGLDIPEWVTLAGGLAGLVYTEGSDANNIAQWGNRINVAYGAYDHFANDNKDALNETAKRAAMLGVINYVLGDDGTIVDPVKPTEKPKAPSKGTGFSEFTQGRNDHNDFDQDLAFDL